MFPTDFETKFTMENPTGSANEEMPFRVLLLGDWSGRESRFATIEPPEFKTVEIDRDNFDEVMRKLAVKLSLSYEGNDKNNISLDFKEIDDFHPDQIFQNLPVFAGLREVRRKLLKPETFGEAAREVNSWLINNETKKPSEAESINLLENAESSENLFDQILGNYGEDSFKRQSVQKSELSEFVSRIVRPHIVQTDLSEQPKLLLIVDEVISDLMRNILHHPQFKALESAWRGLSFLVRRVETNSNMKIYLMDITNSELSDDLKSSDDLTDSSFFETVKSGASGVYADDEPWSLIGGNYSFSLKVDDIAFLLRIAKIADDSIAPFISHIGLDAVKFFTSNSLEGHNKQKIFETSAENKLWTTLRSASESDFLGLLSPRFLGRLPYSEQAEPVENFAFEELLSFDQHENYLWLNPIFACVLMLAQTFSQYDWDISANLNSEITDMPVHFYREDNETKSISCTEIVFNERSCEQLSSEGIMSLISFRNSDKIRLAGLQSIATSSSALNGRWK